MPIHGATVRVPILRWEAQMLFEEPLVSDTLSLAPWEDLLLAPPAGIAVDNQRGRDDC